MPEINIYFGILLLLGALFMSGLAMSTCIHVFRLRNKRMSWRAGRLGGFPLFSTLFLLVSVILSVVMWRFGSGWDIAEGGLYLIFSSSWFVSSYFSSKRYVTDHGIVKNVNDPAQTIAWHQIHDFFDRREGKYQSYIFIYRRKNDDSLKEVVRLRLNIPDKEKDDFKKLISHKLGRRISCYNNEESIDVTQFE